MAMIFYFLHAKTAAKSIVILNACSQNDTIGENVVYVWFSLYVYYELTKMSKKNLLTCPARSTMDN